MPRLNETLRIDPVQVDQLIPEPKPLVPKAFKLPKNVRWGNHSFERMEERGIGVFEVFSCLAEPDGYGPGKEPHSTDFTRGDITVTVEPDKRRRSKLVITTVLDPYREYRTSPRRPIIPEGTDVKGNQKVGTTASIRRALEDEPGRPLTIQSLRDRYPHFSELQLKGALNWLVTKGELVCKGNWRTGFQWVPAEPVTTRPVEKAPQIDVEATESPAAYVDIPEAPETVTGELIPHQGRPVIYAASLPVGRWHEILSFDIDGDPTDVEIGFDKLRDGRVVVFAKVTKPGE